MSAEPISLQTGDLEAIFERDTCQLRYLKIAGIELIRGIYPTVRALDWGTVLPQELNVTHSVNTKAAQRIEFSGRNRSEQIDYRFSGTVECERASSTRYTVRYRIEGKAVKPFQTNRTGLCILHPRSAQGISVEIEHDHGPCEASAFPTTIKPGNPFDNVKSLAYDPAPGFHVRIELLAPGFEGPAFETEDQRNWMDPSFKTYCWPQYRGTPYTVGPEKPVLYEVKLTVDTPAIAPEPSPIPAESGMLPNLGTVLTRSLSSAELARLSALGLGHVQSNAMGYPAAKQTNLPVFLQSSVGVLPIALSPSDALIIHPPANAKEHNHFRGSKKFVGTLGNFVDLNRSRPDPADLAEVDGVVIAANPQIHAFDSLTLFEATWTLRDIAATARSFGAKQILMGPITLRQGTPDPRMSGMESVLFTVAALAHLAAARVEYATFFDAASLITSPAELIFHLLGDHQGKPVRVWAAEPEMVMIEAGRLMVANLSARPTEAFKRTDIETPSNLLVGLKGSNRIIDASNCENWREVLKEPASHNPLTSIPPFSVAIL